MKKFIVLGFLFFLAETSIAVSLLQETKEIVCEKGDLKVTIEKKDKYFETLKEHYKSVEFLDRGILGKSDSGMDALINMAPQQGASLIEGKLFEFREKDCEQELAHKVCKTAELNLVWSATSLTVNGVKLPVMSYGVYPNDGTYFMAYDIDGNKGSAIIDFGSKVFVLHGEQNKLNCKYK